MIPYGRQQITQDDIDAVVDVLKSNFLTQGPAVPAFEAALCTKVGSRFAVAANSATSSLHLACMAVGLEAGDLLWTVPNTFVASANCARYCGATVDFVDIDPRTWNIDVQDLEERLRKARTTGRLPRVVVPVHFAGQPTDQERIFALAQEYGFRVIEDASHAIGASRSGERVGSCRWSDITIFSFHPVKIVTTGEGGASSTNDSAMAAQMARLRTHGITRDACQFVAAAPDDGGWYYEQQSLGLNYRMTDIAAALGTSQMTRLDQLIAERNRLAAVYHDALKDLPVQLPFVRPENRSAYHLYVIRVTGKKPERVRRQVFDRMRASGIAVNVHYIPVHLQPYYRALGFAEGSYPEAEMHGKTAITLPLYFGLTAADQARVISELRSALETAS